MWRSIVSLTLIAACGGGGHDSGGGPDAADVTGDGNPGHVDAPPAAGARTVIVIPMENEPASKIYGNTTNAPYINGLRAMAASAMMFQDELPSLPSEPHYIWMEAGTNVFSDHTFSNDNDASSANSTTSTAHLSAQLDAAGLSWKSYQEGITSGSCPISSTGMYAAKHDPFVFFRDVSGSPPSTGSAPCKAHHFTLTDLAADVSAGNLPRYAFITPNLCHDMHGDLGCPSGISTNANIKAGDDWLAANLPPLIAYTHSHDAVIFLIWDEGDSSNLVPFLAIGDHVVTGTTAVVYNHGSMIKTIERMFGLPTLPAVASTTDFAAMFQPGYLP